MQWGELILILSEIHIITSGKFEVSHKHRFDNFASAKFACVSYVNFLFSGFKLSLITSSDYYRDFYFYKYMNGSQIDAMDNIRIEKPRNLKFFLKQFESGDILSNLEGEHLVPSPNFESYKCGHPLQNFDMSKWMEDHRILTRVGNSILLYSNVLKIESFSCF